MTHLALLLLLAACGETEPPPAAAAAPPPPPKPKAPSCGTYAEGPLNPAADAKLTWPPEAPPHPAVVAAGSTCLPALEVCYTAAHATGTTATAGTVDVTLTLADGGVSELLTAGDAPDALEDCVRDRLSQLRVAPGSGDTARVSIVFAWSEP